MCVIVATSVCVNVCVNVKVKLYVHRTIRVPVSSVNTLDGMVPGLGTNIGRAKYFLC